ncbi:MAG: DNRLRE domain-containing protein, partial [Clostridiales bacterium]|nr:DNRLRE domain-containing protein [Clostridiales bacterium]
GSATSSWFQIRQDGWDGTPYTRRGYVKFDLSAIAVAAQDIQSAEFVVYPMDPIADGGLNVYGLDSAAWDYSLTWNNAPAHSGAPLDTVTTAAGDPFVSFDVTDYIKHCADLGIARFTLVLVGNYGSPYYNLYSSAADASVAPQLRLTATGVSEPTDRLAYVNAVTSAAAMADAFEGVPGLDLSAFAALAAAKRLQAAQLVLDARPDGGFADEQALQDAIDAAIASVSPPFAPNTLIAAESFGSGNAGNIRVVEMNAAPSDGSLSALVGLAPAGGLPESGADLPAAVAFGADGSLKALGAGGLVADATLAYSAGETWHLKFQANLLAQTYDVWATPPSGQPALLARDVPLNGALADIGFACYESDELIAVAGARLIQSDFEGLAGFGGNSYLIESDNTKAAQVFKYDVVHAQDRVDTLVSFLDSSKSVGTWGDLAFIQHTDVNAGTFDVRDDGAYRADAAMLTQAGVLYHVKFEINLAAKTYSVWMTPEGGEPVRLAANYKARNYSAQGYPFNNLGQVSVISEPAGMFHVRNLIALDPAQLELAIDAVNGAAGAAEMSRALASTALGLTLGDYARLNAEAKEALALGMIGKAPFASDADIQAELDRAVVAHGDLLPPEKPGSVQVYISNTLQASITWQPSADDYGIRCYKVFRDGLEIAVVSGDATGYTDKDLLPGETYEYVVKAQDMAGHETASDPVFATAPDEGSLAWFPFDRQTVDAAFEAGLLDYNFSTATIGGVTYQYVMEWVSSALASANAMKYLTMIAEYEPGYLGPDGVTTAAERALAQFRSVISGGAEPGCSGNGLSSQGYLPVLQAFTYAKNRAPAIWDALTDAEKAKIDLIMEAAAIASHFCYSDANDNKTGLDNIGNFDKEWNPNHRAGLLGGIMSAYYFGGAGAVNAMLAGFDYDAFMARLSAANLTNIHRVFSNTPKAKLVADTTNDGPEGFKYKGHTLSEPGKWVAELSDFTFSGGAIRPYGGDTFSGGKFAPTEQFPYGYYGFLVSGYDEFPNLGADGMGFEFDSVDANGARSGLEYVNMGWKCVLEGFTMLQCYDGFAPDGSIGGLSAQEYNEAMVKISAGTIDLLYKNENGYSSYHKGEQTGLEKMEGLDSKINIDIWGKIVNNPIEILNAGANAATGAAAMRAAIEAPELSLVLHAYGFLDGAGKDAVAEAALAARGAAGYESKEALQAAVSLAVTGLAIDALNAAQDAGAYAAALTSPALGAYLPSYDELGAGDKALVAERLLEERPDGGYASRAEIRAAVAAQTNRLTSPAIAAINAAADAGAMLDALLAGGAELGLDISGLLGYAAQYRLIAAQNILAARPFGGFDSSVFIQAAIDGAVAELGLLPLIDAISAAAGDGDAAALDAALRAPQLALGLGVYIKLSEAGREAAAEAIFAAMPDGGFADRQAVQAALDAAVESLLERVSAIASADTMIQEGAPNDAHGFINWMTIKDGWGTGRMLYLKFDLAGIAAQAQDPGAVLLHAELKLYVSAFYGNGRDSGTLAAFALADDSWTEGGLTWNNAPYKPVFENGPAGSVIVPEAGASGYWPIDVTEYVRQAVADGKTELSIVVAGINKENVQFNFETREGSAATAPRLDALYEQEGGGQDPGTDPGTDPDPDPDPEPGTVGRNTLQSLAENAGAIIEGAFEAASWGAFEEALADAWETLGDDEADQAAISAAYGALEGAIGGLAVAEALDGDYAALVRLLLEAALKDRNSYTETSWNYLESVVAEAWELVEGTTGGGASGAGAGGYGPSGNGGGGGGYSPLSDSSLEAIIMLDKLQRAIYALVPKDQGGGQQGEPFVAAAISGGIYAETPEVALVEEYWNVSDGIEARFVFSAGNFKNVGTAELVLNYPESAKGISVALGDVLAGDPEKGEEDLATIGYGDNGNVPTLPGYKALRVYLRAPDGPNTLTLPDGTVLLTITVTFAADYLTALPGGGAYALPLALTRLKFAYYDSEYKDGEESVEANAKISAPYASALARVFSRFDVNLDGKVTLADVETVRFYLGQQKTDGAWASEIIARCDLDPDDRIEIADLTLALSKYESL